MGSRAGHSEVTLEGRCIVAVVVSGRCQDFGNSGRGGELKNWKPEKLTVCNPDQIPRISEFQLFTYSAHSGILPTGPGRGTRSVLSVGFTVKIEP